MVRGGYGIYYEQEHPSGPILNAINPPPGGIGAADAAYSGFGFTRDFTAPALSMNPLPSLFWNNFSRGTAAIPARVAVNAVDPHAPRHVRAAVESGDAEASRRQLVRGCAMSRIRPTKSSPARISTYRATSIRCTCSGTAALIRPGFSSITWRQSDGSGQYHSLQTRFERRVRSAQILVSYTWGHAISDAEQGQSAVGVGNPGTFHFLSNRKLDKSSTTFDIRQRLTTAVVYELPLFRDQTRLAGKGIGRLADQLHFHGSNRQRHPGDGRHRPVRFVVPLRPPRPGRQP